MRLSLHEEATSSGQPDAAQSPDGEMSFRRPSRQHGSLDSTTSSMGTISHSQRSSFAMERASLDANRSSLELFGISPQPRAVSIEAGNNDFKVMCRQMGIPENMSHR